MVIENEIYYMLLSSENKIYKGCIMIGKSLVLVFISFLMSGLSYGYLLTNLSFELNYQNKTISLKWDIDETAQKIKEVSYMVFKSSNSWNISNNYLVNSSEFLPIGVVNKEEDQRSFIFIDNEVFDKNYYVIVTRTNGVVVLGTYSNAILMVDYKEPSNSIVPSGILPSVLTQNVEVTSLTNITNISSKTNIIAQDTNIVASGKPLTNAISITNFFTNYVYMTNLVRLAKKESFEVSDLDFEFIPDDFKVVLRDYFFKGRYRDTIEILNRILEEDIEEDMRDLIKVYLARSYYSIGKKRKALRILIDITSENIREISEFWLNRFSRYFWN